MKKIITLVIVAGLTSLVAKAQSFDVSLFPEKRDFDPLMVKYRNSYYTFELDMEGMSGFSANLKRFMHNIRLKKYNTWLEEEQQQKVNAPDKGFGPLPPALKVINDKLHLLYFKNEGKGPLSLWIAHVDTSSLEVSGHKEILKIDEGERYIQYYLRSVDTHHPNRIVYKTSETQGPDQSFRSFFVESSADGSQHLVAWTSGWNNNLYFSVLDRNFTISRSKTEKLPDENSLALSNAFIDNKGTAFFTWHYYKKGKGFAEFLINRSAGSQVKTIVIENGESSGICAVIDEAKGYFLACGAYKEGSDNLKGVYAQPFSLSDAKPGPLSKSVFPQELLDLLDNEGWANKKEKKQGLFDAITFEAMLLENGMLNMTGEFRRRTTGTRAVFDISGSLLNARFDKANMAVFSRIPKVRVSAGSTIGDSYRVFSHKNKVIIFYNDHLSNLKMDMSATPKRSDVYTNSVLAAALIDETGVVKREVVKDLSAEDYLGITSSMQMVSSGVYYIPFRRIKNLGGITRDVKWALIQSK